MNPTKLIHHIMCGCGFCIPHLSIFGGHDKLIMTVTKPQSVNEKYLPLLVIFHLNYCRSNFDKTYTLAPILY